MRGVTKLPEYTKSRTDFGQIFSEVLALCWALGLTSAGGFTRAGSVTMEAEAARRVMRSVVAPRTARTSHGRERESRVGVLGPADRCSFGGKAPPGRATLFPTHGLSFLRRRSLGPPLRLAVAPLGSGGLKLFWRPSFGNQPW